MKQIIRFFAYVMVFLAVIYASTSQIAYDYNSPESYKNPDFLRNSDPSKWDAKKIDWTNQAIFENPNVYKRSDIYNNPQVYNNPTFYKNLPDDKYKMLDYKQVQFDKIGDHRKINGNKYIRDLGCIDCYFDVPATECKNYNPSTGCLPIQGLPKGTLEYSSNGIKHISGDYVSIPGSLKSDTKAKVIIQATKEYIRISMASDKIIKIPQTDSFTFSAIENKVNYADTEMYLSAGEFVLKNGVTYVKKYNYGHIDGIEIIGRNTDVRLFFDGQEHADCRCNYVSMNKDTKTITNGVAKSDSIMINFYEGNKFILLNAPLRIIQYFGTIIVQDRSNKELLPEIKMKFTPDGWSKTSEQPNEIKNGNIKFEVFSSGKVQYVVQDPDDFLTVKFQKFASNPLVLSIEDNKGQSIIPKQSLLSWKVEPQKIIFGANNEVSMVNYKDLGSKEPLRNYFRFADDTSMERVRAQEADNRINEMQDETKAKWGNPGMRVFGYMDDNREIGIIKALKNGCGAASVSLDFCTSVAFNEGLNVFIEKRYYKDPNTKVSGFIELGLDNIGSEIEDLKKKGYLRKDFNEYETAIAYNEARQKVVTADFKSVDYAIEAIGARLKYTQDIVKRDAARFGYTLTNDQLDYWTYVYYNCGPACKTQRLENGHEIPSKPGVIGKGDPIGNAKRVLATRDLLENARIFDRTLSQKVASK